MGGVLHIAELASLGQRSFTSSEAAIAQVTELVQRLSGVDITVLSEVRGGDYRFAGLEAVPELPLVAGSSAIPFESSLCSRVHLGQAPAVVPDMRDEPALWENWLKLKQGLGVDWDIRAFCTTEVRLPDGSLYGTLCLHHREPRAFSEDEQALLAVLARLAGDEIARERARGELDAAVEQLARAEALRAELVEELAHELRAPLQVIDGYVEGMLDGVLEREDATLALIRREAGRSVRLLDDLSYLTRLETAARHEEPDRVDLAAAVDDAIIRFAPLATAAGATLRAETVPVTALVPRGRLEQVLVNLTRNALLAVSEDGSSVVLFARAEGEWALVGVEDDGPGIPSEEMSRVFERFYRGRVTRDRQRGSGLGLTVVRRIAEASSGAVSAQQREPRGVRVVVRLPLA
ncbi:MAG TPA: ATP-binding protein [Gaiellales bacterium]|nr:ATP-binding protein [Gaiellales bacterium]